MSISASGRCRVRPADQAGPAGGAAARLACGLRQRLLWVCPKSEVLHVVARASSGALSRHSERRLCRRWTVWRMSPPRPSPMHPKSTAPNYAGTRGHLFRACRGFCRSLRGPERLRTPLLVRVVVALCPGGAQRRSPKHRMHCRASCRQVGAYQLTCPCDVWAQRHVMCRSPHRPPGAAASALNTPASQAGSLRPVYYALRAGVAVHWLIFGSSGHASRPPGGVLRSYHRCLQLWHAQHCLVKTIVRTA